MEERRNTIKKMLEKDREVTLQSLALIFPDVSVMTLRRDLQFFQDMGFAFRTHGGARLASYSRQEPYYKLREGENRDAKSAIAKNALRFLEEGAQVFLDSGTTMMTFARALSTYSLQIVTTGPNIALELAVSSNSSFIILGGQLNRHNMSLSGALANENISKMKIGTAFMAASGYTFANGLTCGSHNEAELKRLVIQRAEKKILLIDSSKFGKEMLFPFAALSDFDAVITEKEPPAEIVALAEKHNTQIIY